MSTPAGIDPRGPRFAASVTALLLVIAVALGLTGISTEQADGPASDGASTAGGWAIAVVPVSERIVDAAFLLLLAIALLFLWGVLSPRTQPWGLLYRSVIRPLIAPPAELEDPRPPRFAQGVGLFVVGLGLLLHLLGVPLALTIAAAAAFVAAFLNAGFGFCLGCQLYLLLRRAGILRDRAA